MLKNLMIARFREPVVVAALVLFGGLAPACQKVPLLAPAGSTITLTASATALPTNGSASIIAQVIEASGTPPHSGTLISFTTSLGTIEPSDARTDASGRVTVTFRAGGLSGTATISAISGGANVGANGAVKIAVGSAAVGRVNVSANPATVSSLGGSSVITANVLDINGNPLTSVPVTFSTTAGSLSAAVITADQNGNAQTTLTTAQQATVTASVGATGSTPPTTGGGTGGTGGGTGGTGTGSGNTSGQASGSVTVTIAAAPTLIITPPSTPPSAGLPAAFTFAVTAATTNGSAVRDVTVDWGDGSGQDLGVINGSQIVNHVYNRSGNFTVSAIITDATGNSSRVSTGVSVIPVPRPTINIQATPGAPGTNSANFTITVTSPSGIAIQDVTIRFGDGTSQDLGGAPTGTISNIQHVYGSSGQKNVQVDVLDSAGQVTTGTAVVIVS